jgi:hypothetical protein
MWEEVKRKDRSPQEEEMARKNARMDADMETSFKFCQRLTKMMEGYKGEGKYDPYTYGHGNEPEQRRHQEVDDSIG